MTEKGLAVIERCMRLVREATDMSEKDRAICNYTLHDALDQLEQYYAASASANNIDVDSLTAELDAARVQLGTLRAQLAEIERQTAGDATIAHRYDVGYHAGVNDDPAPMGDDEWFVRGFKYGQAQCDIAGMHQDIANLRKQLSDAETALEELRTTPTPEATWGAGFDSGRKGDPDPSETATDVWFVRGWRDAARARTILELEREVAAARERLKHVDTADGTAEAFWEAGFEAGTNNESAPGEFSNVWFERGWSSAVHIKLRKAETSTQNQTPAVVILDATPAELAAVATTHTNGDDQEPAKNGKSKSFRFAGTDQDLRKQTVNAIKTIAKRIGRTPTIIDWDVDCRTYGLPTFQAIQSRLNCTWSTLVTDAGLTPSRKGSRHEGI